MEFISEVAAAIGKDPTGVFYDGAIFEACLLVTEVFQGVTSATGTCNVFLAAECPESSFVTTIHVDDAHPKWHAALEHSRSHTIRADVSGQVTRWADRTKDPDSKVQLPLPHAGCSVMANVIPSHGPSNPCPGCCKLYTSAFNAALCAGTHPLLSTPANRSFGRKATLTARRLRAKLEKEVDRCITAAEGEKQAFTARECMGIWANLTPRVRVEILAAGGQHARLAAGAPQQTGCPDQNAWPFLMASTLAGVANVAKVRAAAVGAAAAAGDSGDEEDDEEVLRVAKSLWADAEKSAAELLPHVLLAGLAYCSEGLWARLPAAGVPYIPESWNGAASRHALDAAALAANRVSVALQRVRAAAAEAAMEVVVALAEKEAEEVAAALLIGEEEVAAGGGRQAQVVAKKKKKKKTRAKAPTPKAPLTEHVVRCVAAPDPDSEPEPVVDTQALLEAALSRAREAEDALATARLAEIERERKVNERTALRRRAMELECDGDALRTKATALSVELEKLARRHAALFEQRQALLDEARDLSDAASKLWC